MVGKNWRDLFDMVIVQADKPNFFTDRRKCVSRDPAGPSAPPCRDCSSGLPQSALLNIVWLQELLSLPVFSQILSEEARIDQAGNEWIECVEPSRKCVSKIGTREGHFLS